MKQEDLEKEHKKLHKEAITLYSSNANIIIEFYRYYKCI